MPRPPSDDNTLAPPDFRKRTGQRHRPARINETGDKRSASVWKASAQNKARPVRKAGFNFEVGFDFAAGCEFDFAFEFVSVSSAIVLGGRVFFALSKHGFIVRTDAKKDVGAKPRKSPKRRTVSSSASARATRSKAVLSTAKNRRLERVARARSAVFRGLPRS